MEVANNLSQEIIDKFELQKYSQDSPLIQTLSTILNSNNKNYLINMEPGVERNLCYIVPGLSKNRGTTIIFSPSLAYINDQMHYLGERKIVAETINGTIDFRTRDEIRAKVLSLAPNFRFLFVTTEVINQSNYTIMEDFMNEIKELKGGINYVVIEEAHKILHSTRNYRTSLTFMPKYRLDTQDFPWIALTYIDKSSELNLAKELQMSDNLKILKNITLNSNVFYDSEENDSSETLADFINRVSPNGEAGIVFCKLVDHVINTHRYLALNQIGSRKYHGSSEDNPQTINDWVEGKFQVLVATGESFGFNIRNNMPVLNFVVHLNMPQEFISFIHESIMTGNHGKLGYSRVYKTTSRFSFIPCQHNNQIACGYFLRAPCKRQFLLAFLKLESCEDDCNKCRQYTNKINHEYDDIFAFFKCSNDHCKRRFSSEMDLIPRCGNMCDRCIERASSMDIE